MNEDVINETNNSFQVTKDFVHAVPDMMPNGNHLKDYRQKGFLNVVRGIDSGERGICQNPELASSLENTLAPASCAIVWSTEGRGCRSLHMLSFNRLRSTPMRTWPFGLGTTTMPAHQSVGSLTLMMTPNFSIRSSLALTDLRSTEGIRFCSFLSLELPKTLEERWELLNWV